MSKKILIIGNSAKEYALAKKLSENNEVYVAPGSPSIKEFATCVDIREDSVTELLEFVMENDIDLTIPTSAKSISANISEVFANNNQTIFAPTAKAAKLVFDKASLKKALYKLRIPTPKFGIFEKQNMAADYIKNLKSPFVLKTNEPCSATVLTSQKTAKNILDNYFAQKNQKIIIEDYIWGSSFTFYAITDGYKALPIGSSLTYKHSLEGEGGQLTSGMGACSPNYKLSLDNEYFLMDNVIYPILEYLEAEGNPYIGIMGVDGILTDDGCIHVLGLQHFTQDCDTNSVLEILNSDLINLFNSCIIGSFSDEYEYIEQKDISTTSLVLNCKNKDTKNNSIEGLDNLEDETLVAFYPNTSKNKYLEYEANSGSVLVLTAKGRTVTSSLEKAYEEAEAINFAGISYRKDIGKSITANV